MDLNEWINTELPQDGEWWSDGNEAFMEAAMVMSEHGMGNELIKVILTKLYSAVQNEFGN